MSGLAVAAFAAEAGEHVLDAPRGRRFDVFLRSFDEAAYRRRLTAAGVSWIGRGDELFPPRLRAIHDPPPGSLRPHARAAGPRRAADRRDRRRSCVLGLRVERRAGLARELAAAGVVIVSGLARGVDAAAHRGALETGTTIAVLGCGVDRDYPRAHAALAAEIAAAGPDRLRVRAGSRAGPVALPGSKPDRRRARGRDRRRRGSRAERGADHGRPGTRRGSRGARRARRDHECALTRHEPSPAARSDPGHVRRRRLHVARAAPAARRAASAARAALSNACVR